MKNNRTNFIFDASSNLNKDFEASLHDANDMLTNKPPAYFPTSQ